MFSVGEDERLVSPAGKLRIQLITKKFSAGTSRAFLFCTYGIYNPVRFIPRTFYFPLIWERM